MNGNLPTPNYLRTLLLPVLPAMICKHIKVAY